MILTDGGGDIVIEIAEVLPREVALDKTFKVTDAALIAGGDEGVSITLDSGATGAADAVDVVLVLEWEVVVDDVGDAGDIESTRGDIGADEDAKLRFFESIKRTLALVLGAVSVDRFGSDAGLIESLGEAASGVLHFSENEDAEELGAFEEFLEELELEMRHDLVNLLVHRFSGVRALADFYENGFLLELAGEFFNWAGKGGGKEEGLAIVRDFSSDLSDGGEESHVEEAVGFIEDEHF